MAEFTVTLACADTLHMGENIEDACKGGAGGVHIDIMDGHYVPNLCMSFDQASDIRQAYPGVPMDIHMMVSQPFSWMDVINEIHPHGVAIHLDTTPFSYRFLQKLRKENIRAGIALNPSQPVEMVYPLLNLLDYVLLMAVEPGFSGQFMLPETVERISQLAFLRKREKRSFDIMVDGGVDLNNCQACIKAGADILVGGALCCFGQKESVLEACKRFGEALK